MKAGSASRRQISAVNSGPIPAIHSGPVAASASSDATLSSLRAGTPGGPRAVFVHGTPGRARDWSAVFKHVPPGLEFIAIDRPGFGGEADYGPVTSLVLQANRLSPMVRELPRRRTVLVGHSYGAPVVVQTALLNPGLIDGMILLAGALDPSLERVHPLQSVARWPGVRWLLPRHLYHANEELLALRGELERLALGVHMLATPVTIVHGERDRLVPFANVAWMKQQFSAVPILETHALKEEDHFLPWTQPALIQRLVSEALDQ